MVTYIYWALVIGLAVAVFAIGLKTDKVKLAAIGSIVVFAVGWTAYYFHLQQIFVKRWGGVMSISVPAGQFHMGATWKDEHLWVENYDPRTNTCHFTEYSKGNLLQGKVTIKNCNPLMPKSK